MQRWPQHGEACRQVTFDALLEDLSATLTRLPAKDREPALAAAAEMLGRGIGAEQVCFYQPSQTPGRLDRVEHGSRALAPASQTAAWIDLDRLPHRGEELRAGRTEQSVGVQQIGSRRRSPAGQSDFAGWALARSTLFVPCMGPDGLLAVACIEGSSASSGWSGTAVGRARLVGCLVANFLERHRLAGELDALRTCRGHDDRLETLGRVASSVAHDFNNILTAILGYTDLLEMELSENAPGWTELDEIRSAATRAGDLVEQVLCFGRTRLGGVREIALDGMLADLGSMLQRVVGDGIEVAVSRGVEAATIRIDPGRLERVLLNLASNAREAIRERAAGSGHFALSTRMVVVGRDGCDPTDPDAQSHPIPELRAGRYVRLSASDDGCGVDPATAERIFEPFFTTRGATTGNGLGLATAAEVVREARGAIRVESTPGEGCTFHLYFPSETRAAPVVHSTSVASPRLDPHAACV